MNKEELKDFIEKFLKLSIEKQIILKAFTDGMQYSDVEQNQGTIKI